MILIFLQLEAEDKDEAGTPNSQIEYEMIEQDGDYFDLNPNTGDIKVCIVINIGHCKEYPTMHYFEILRYS